MRYVIEFLVPAMIVVVVAVVLFRNRTNTPAPASASQGNEDTGTLSTGTFVAILIIGATFTVALIYALHNSTS
jgi:heme/copper-type cytochrome/quinol oxidase subunit 2